jgi:hypothetical protein
MLAQTDIWEALHSSQSRLLCYGVGTIYMIRKQWLSKTGIIGSKPFVFNKMARNNTTAEMSEYITVKPYQING